MPDPPGEPPTTLSLETLLTGVQVLTERDPDLAAIVHQYGPPPLWAREPGFGTLIYIILEQQVSLASARAAYTRLTAALNPLTPQAFLALEEAALKLIGFSRQKTAYARLLAGSIMAGQLDLQLLSDLPDEALRAILMKEKGIGRWTADIYLMEALLRPDVWPAGDLALAIAVQRAKRLPTAPRPPDLEAIGEEYRPYRAVAARLFWHAYLSDPSRKRAAIP